MTKNENKMTKTKQNNNDSSQKSEISYAAH